MSALVNHAPQFTVRAATEMALDIYGLAAQAQPLPSERDQNFYLETEGGAAYVLKLANATESLEVLDVQNRAMMHIAAQKGELASGLRFVPHVCPTEQGEYITQVRSRQGKMHFVRLLTYLPGQVLAAVKEGQAEVIVVDNGSTDGSLEYLKNLAAKKKWVKLVTLTRNYGFGYAVNLGVKKARGKIVVLFNNDVLPLPFTPTNASLSPAFIFRFTSLNK